MDDNKNYLLEEIKKIKIDMNVVNAISVYNIQSEVFLFQEGSISFFDSLLKTACLEHTSFVFYDTATDSYFLKKHNELIIIVTLKNDVNYNKVLLDMSCMKVLTSI